MCAYRFPKGVIDRPTLTTNEELFGVALELPSSQSRFTPGPHLLRLETPSSRNRVPPIHVLIQDPKVEMGLGLGLWTQGDDLLNR